MGRGGAWVVAQVIVMTAWFSAHAERTQADTDSALRRVAAAVLLSGGGAAGVSGALVLGESLTPFPKLPAQAQLVRRGILYENAKRLRTVLRFNCK